jgi:hypothetical protein
VRRMPTTKPKTTKNTKRSVAVRGAVVAVVAMGALVAGLGCAAPEEPGLAAEPGDALHDETRMR